MHPTPEKFRKFLAGLLASEILDPIECNHWEEDGLKLVSTFITSPLPLALYVSITENNYALSFEFPTKLRQFEHVLILSKLEAPIFDSRTLLSQINVVNLPGTQGPDYEETSKQALDQIQNIISSAVVPYFDLTSQNEQKDAFRTSSLLSVDAKKKFNELATSLAYLRQRVQVPDLLSLVPEYLRDLLQKLQAAEDTSITSDTELLNQLTGIVNGWIRQIQSITLITKANSEDVSMLDEIQLCKSLEESMVSLQSQLKQKEVTTALAILNAAKRFQVSLSFFNDLNIESSLTEIRSFNALLKDLPVDLIMYNKGDSLDYPQFEANVDFVFDQLKKWKNSLSLPLSRMINLIEQIVIALVDYFAHILASLDLFIISLEEFDQYINTMMTPMFSKIESNVKYMENLLRELLRKRAETFFIIKIDLAVLNNLKERATAVQGIRKNYIQLKATLHTLPNADDLIAELANAYSRYCSASTAFEFTKQGYAIWSLDQHSYIQFCESLKSQLSAFIHQGFEGCVDIKDYSDFLSSFIISKDSTLHLITALINDDQKMRILECASSEIRLLLSSTASITIPEKTDGSNIYKEIELELMTLAKVLFYVDFLETVLGTSWAKFSLGTQISELLKTLSSDKKLQTLAAKWVRNANEIEPLFSLPSPILRVENIGIEGTQIYLNDQKNLTLLLSEAQSLIAIDCEMPVALISCFNRLSAFEEIFVNLKEHLELLRLIFDSMAGELFCGNPIEIYFEKRISLCLVSLKKLHEISWKDLLQQSGTGEPSALASGQRKNDPVQLVLDFQDNVWVFNAELNHFLKSTNELNIAIDSQDLAPENALQQIEKYNSIARREIERLQLSDYSNMNGFVLSMNQRFADKMGITMQDRLQSFIKNLSERSASNSEPAFRHDLFFDGELIELKPPLKESKELAVSHLEKIIREFCSIEVPSIGAESEYFVDYIADSLQFRISTSLNELDEMFAMGLSYWSKWTNFFDDVHKNPDEIFLFDEFSIENLHNWLNTLKRVLAYSSLLESSDGVYDVYNAIRFRFKDVQSHLIFKYEEFKKNILQEFLSQVQRFSDSVFQSIVAIERSNSEVLDINFETDKFFKRLLDYFDLESSISNLNQFILGHHQSQVLLKRTGHKFDQNWIYTEQLESKLANIRTIASLCDTFVQSHFGLIRIKIEEQHKNIKDALESFEIDWGKKKPISQDLEPFSALSVLTKFQSSLESLNKRHHEILSVSTKFDLSLSPLETEDLAHEIQVLQSIWSELHGVWDVLVSVQKLSWDKVNLHTMRSELQDALLKLKSCSQQVKVYSAFTSLEHQINDLLMRMPLVIELKSEAMEKRHWKKLFQMLASREFDYESMTVGDVLSLNFLSYESSIRGILEQALGEKLIEDNLRALSDNWSHIVFESYEFEKKCRLIRNWKTLFEECLTCLSTLVSMKSSPYCKPFESNREALETQINDLYVILSIWVDVQSHWIYLYGVFGSNTEIKSSLPLESTRFHNVSLEFLSLMKRVLSFELVIEVTKMKNIGETLQKLFDSLKSTKRGLFDYLDTQRDRFPRFYFIGNDDLLELLGCSTQLSLINKHIGLMFAGVGSILLEESTTNVIAVMSPQGEVLNLRQPLLLKNSDSFTEWMTAFEMELKLSVANEIKNCVHSVKSFEFSSETVQSFTQLLTNYPIQAVVVAFQIRFSSAITESTTKNHKLTYDKQVNAALELLQQLIAATTDKLTYLKALSLTIELLHHKSVLSELKGADDQFRSLIVQKQQIYILQLDEPNPLDQLVVQQGRSQFSYGFEYQGVMERLAITPLVQNCFLSMSQAMSQKMGGSPFGPAGTGKTECVKALGNNLGRMVLIFCCDETFDYQSMGRLMLGICKVGCWGCFDEFNRLDTKILSAISSFIEKIGSGLRNPEILIELNNNLLNVHPETGIFVTMNPTYAGRHELPENLKKMFRAFSMDTPDATFIARTLLEAQGFGTAKDLSAKLVNLFSLLSSKIKKQIHYDFGLRALKSVLNACGSIKRATSEPCSEDSFMLQAIKLMIAPKLIQEDNELLEISMFEIFGGDDNKNIQDDQFKNILATEANLQGITPTDQLLTKVLQIAQILKACHGFMILGDAGCGKSTLISLTLRALSRLENTEIKSITIDGKSLSKETLFGSFDPSTREWTDGLFPKIIRQVIHNVLGEVNRHVWIVFDGDIDPEWAENLNSVLDDNKILTLPNGERLKLPPYVRVIFEVNNLASATPATITRCGMVWIDEALVKPECLVRKLAFDFKTRKIERFDGMEDIMQRQAVKLFYEKLFNKVLDVMDDEFSNKLSCESSKLSHIMPFLQNRALTSLFSYLAVYCERVESIDSFDYSLPCGDAIISKSLLLSIAWAYSGDCKIHETFLFAKFLVSQTPFIELEAPDIIMQYHFFNNSFEWQPWSDSVNCVELEPQQVLDTSLVVPTIDTTVLESIIRGILNQHKPLILCGPPGSGKTMTLFRTLRDLPDFDFVSLNFSKDTSAETLITTLEQHCEYKNTISGSVLAPKIEGKWLILFCDEINLPAVDQYGSQRTINFLRQLVEKSGFWRALDLTWVLVENVQIVGACNDPNDPGRNAMSDRFLRHISLLMIDHPSETGMEQIYSVFNSAVLKCAPSLKHYATPLTRAMLEVYGEMRGKMTVELKAHYIYSPRELTRWCRGILLALLSKSYERIQDFLQIWIHEALRLFFDRIVDDDSKKWCVQMIERVAKRHFPIPNFESVLSRPLLFTSWLTGKYQLVEKESLIKFLRGRLKVFCEEEINTQVVLYDELLDHVLRIDRVLKQAQGHMMLVGTSASGKSTLVKFVSWMNGFKLVQLRVHSGYTVDEFEATLRKVLVSCVKGTKICFLIDESCILESSFIERMNSLLANSEIPGLFEGEYLDSLLNVCAAESASQGLLLESPAELNEWFKKQVTAHLHVVFTVCDIYSEKNALLQSSPALFNRCVINWMGNWSMKTLGEVAEALLAKVPMDQSDYSKPKQSSVTVKDVSSFRDAIVESAVRVHSSVASWTHLQYPSIFLRFLKVMADLLNEKERDLETNQRLICVGLEKIKETTFEVSRAEKMLQEKRNLLSTKNEQAKKMLNQMILDQNEAERKKEFSEDAQIEIKKQEKEIQLRQEFVMKNLEDVEPAVLEAQRGVQNIKKQHLTEIRSMTNPPAAVKMAMESVCVLLGYQVNSWREVQLIVRKDDFITNIVNYNSEEHLSPEMKSFMEEQYLSREDYNFEVVNRASQACGPLVQWVIAQLNYYSILEKIEPLREEVSILEQSATQSRARLIAIAQMIDELEETIESYKTEYSELIGQVECTKIELSQIEQKVDRSKQLISSLTIERTRWQENVHVFSLARNQLAGNCILGAAFAAYCGGLSQKCREQVTLLWKIILEELGIMFDSALLIPSMLTSRILNVNVEDEFFLENLAIKTWNFLPLVVDPSGSFEEYANSNENDIGYESVSFVDNSLGRVIEDTLKFGGSLMLRNVECYNPLLNPLIQNDISYKGGHKSIDLGNNTIMILGDYSIVFHSRDDRCIFDAFLESRVTLLNFGITEGGLENSVLNIALLSLNPDLFQRRSELLKIQGEYNQTTIQLRTTLLSVLNDCRGTMIDNDSVINLLEDIKVETDLVDSSMERASQTLLEVDSTRGKFHDVAVHVRRIYMILVKLSQQERIYNFTLSQVLDTFHETLSDLGTSFETEALVKLFYIKVFKKFAPSFKRLDRLSFALKLSSNLFSYHHDITSECAITLILTFGNESWEESALVEILNRLLEPSSEFKISTLALVLQDDFDNEMIGILKPLMAESMTCPSRLSLQSLADLLSHILGVSQPISLDWIHIFEQEHRFKNRPVLFCTSRGYDVSYRVRAAAKSMHRTLVEVAMGSRESVNAAAKAIDRAGTNGSWVLLQNIQMTPLWLTELEMQLLKLNAHDGFKLYLTSSFDSNEIPNGLIQMSTVISVEEQPDFRTIVRETFDDISKNSNSELQNYIHLLLSIFYATIQERMKYVPLSFSQQYDINDADADAAAFFISKVFDEITDANPISIPWPEIAFCVGQIIFGGKMSVAADAEYCASLANALFNPKSVKSEFNLISNPLSKGSGLMLLKPEDLSSNGIKIWIESLPDPIPLAYIEIKEETVTALQSRDVDIVTQKMLLLKD